jgi:hypothetical protein
MHTLHRVEIKSFLILLTIIGVVFSAVSYVKAQNTPESGVTISPLIFELNSNPGDTVTNQLKIYNQTEYMQSVDMLAEEFTPYGEEGQVVLEESEDTSSYGVADWISISPSKFQLEAKKQQIVTFIINIPENAEPGGHYVSIVSSISGGTNQITGSGVATKSGALVLLRVSGNITEEIVIDTFSTKSFSEFGPVDFNVRFENTGNVHLKPAGFISITDTFGKKVATLEIPQNNVIPGAVRQARTVWDQVNLKGRYTATLVANYGSNSKKTIVATTTFTVFPWKEGLIILAIIILVVLIAFRMRKRIGLAFKVLIGKH